MEAAAQTNLEVKKQPMLIQQGRAFSGSHAASTYFACRTLFRVYCILSKDSGTVLLLQLGTRSDMQIQVSAVGGK